MVRKWRSGVMVAGVVAAATLITSPIPAGAQAVAPNVAPTAGLQVISTVAGNGHFGFSGDGGPATSAKLSLPGGVAEDIAGNLYIGDTLNNRVRRVTAGGSISTVAGSQPGFGGDGGPAVQAKMSAPTGVAVDGFGNLYIADTGNNRVRRVTPDGTISTYVGTGGGGQCESGDDRATATRTAAGTPTSTHLCRPTGVAVDTGNNLYIADTGNNIIREVTTTGSISTIAGNGRFGSSGDGGPAVDARLGLPTGVAVDALQHVFIADSSNNKIREVTSGGLISTFAGTGHMGFGGDNGPATGARLSHPTGVGIDSVGDVYIADTFNSRIRVVIPKGDISTYAGSGMPGYSGDNGPATSARLMLPSGDMASDGANLFFADTFNQRIRRVQGGPPPNIPESPFSALLLPLSAVVVLGGAVAIVRYRRRKTDTKA